MNNKELNDEILDLIFSISRVMKYEMKFRSPAADLSLLQIQTLMFIEKHSEVQMKDLAGNFTITLPTATNLVDNLVKSKLILRVRSTQDRRVVSVILTKKGERLLTKVVQERNKKMHTMLSYLPQKERVNLLEILKSLKKNMEESNER